jgi:hypothetical protein
MKGNWSLSTPHKSRKGLEKQATERWNGRSVRECSLKGA